MLQINLLLLIVSILCLETMAQQGGANSAKNGQGTDPKLVKTECLASNEDLSTFHCLPVQPLRIPCVDTEVQRCPEWAGMGECSKNPQYMLIHCRKSCHSCIGLHHGDVLQIAPSEELRSQVLQRLVETQEYQHKLAEHSVETLKTCINKHELCTHWSIVGECQANPHYMQRECPAACQTC